MAAELDTRVIGPLVERFFGRGKIIPLRAAPVPTPPERRSEGSRRRSPGGRPAGCRGSPSRSANRSVGIFCFWALIDDLKKKNIGLKDNPPPHQSTLEMLRRSGSGYFKGYGGSDHIGLTVLHRRHSQRNFHTQTGRKLQLGMLTKSEMLAPQPSGVGHKLSVFPHS